MVKLLDRSAHHSKVQEVTKLSLQTVLKTMANEVWTAREGLHCSIEQ